MLRETRDDALGIDNARVNVMVSPSDASETRTARFARPTSPPTEEEEVVVTLRKIGESNRSSNEVGNKSEDNAWGDTAMYTWPSQVNQNVLFGAEESVSSDSLPKESKGFDIIGPEHETNARDTITDISRTVFDKFTEGVDASRVVLESLAFGIDKMKEMTPDRSTEVNTYSDSLLKPIPEGFWDDDDFFSSDDFPDFSGSVNYFRPKSGEYKDQAKSTIMGSEDLSKMSDTMVNLESTTEACQEYPAKAGLPEDINQNGLTKIMQIDMSYGEMDEEEPSDDQEFDDTGLNPNHPGHRRHGHSFVGSKLASLQVFTHTNYGDSNSLVDYMQHVRESEVGKACATVPAGARAIDYLQSLTQDISDGLKKIRQGEAQMSSNVSEQGHQASSHSLDVSEKLLPSESVIEEEASPVEEDTNVVSLTFSPSATERGANDLVEENVDESSQQMSETRKSNKRVAQLKSLRILRGTNTTTSDTNRNGPETEFDSNVSTIEQSRDVDIPVSKDKFALDETDDRVSSHPLKQSVPAIRYTLRDMMNGKRVLTLPDKATHRREQSTFEDSQEVRLETFLLQSHRTSPKTTLKRVFSNPRKKFHRRSKTTLEPSHNTDLESFESRDDDELTTFSSFVSSYIPSHVRSVSHASGSHTTGYHTRSSSNTSGSNGTSGHHTRISSITSGSFGTSGYHTRSSSTTSAGTITSSSGRSLTLLGTFEFTSADGSTEQSSMVESMGPLEILFEHFVGPESDGDTLEMDDDFSKDSSGKLDSEVGVEHSIFSSYLNFIARTFDLDRIYGEGFEMDMEKNIIEWDIDTKDSSTFTPGSYISQLTDDPFIMRKRRLF